MAEQKAERRLKGTEDSFSCTIYVEKAVLLSGK